MNMGVFSRAAFVLLVTASLMACGTGGEQGPPPFEISAVGPGGATVAAGDVTVVFPPNAFAQQTQVSILPEANPLPFLVGAADPCTYSYLGPLWCVGPVGHNVAVPALLIVRYDPALLTAGKTEDDLFLFLWDDAAQALRLAPGAVQDQAANTFTVNNYVELGHLAVMVRTCTGPQQPRVNPVAAFILGQNNPFAPIVSGDGALATPGLYVVDVDADLSSDPPVQVPTNGAVPNRIETSRDGLRILYGVDNNNEGVDWLNVTVQGGSPVTVGSGDNLQSSDLVGWWSYSGGSSEVFYQHFVFGQNGSKPDGGTGNLIEPGRDREPLEIQDATDDAMSTSFHAVPNGAFWVDMRQAPDDQNVLVRWGDFGDGFFERIEIVNAQTGALISDGAVPIGGGEFTPRFAADGQTIFYVSSNQSQAVETNFTGTTTQVVYDSMPQQTGLNQILDFAPSPDGQHFIVIERDSLSQGVVGDTIILGVMDGNGGWTVLEAENLGDQYFYDEIEWHPDGAHAYLAVFSGSAGSSGVIPVTLNPTAALPDRIIVHDPIPVSGMGYVDVNTTDGRLLVTIPSFGQTISPKADSSPKAGSSSAVAGQKIGSGTSAFTAPGIWVSDPDGSNQRLILNNIDQIEIFEPARWLENWRNTTDFSRVR